jgi:DNA topoisomerase-1
MEECGETNNEKFTSNNISTTEPESRYKKLIKNMIKDKSGNRLVKLLSTTSLADIIQVNKWWEQAITDENEEEERWKCLEHNGVLFPPSYEPHGVKIKFKGEEMNLDAQQEELATFWAGLLNNDLSTKETTRKNFFKEFRKRLGERYALSSLEDFDFTPIYEHLEKIRERNRNKSNDDKKLEKEKKQKILDCYGYSLIDGVSERISNYLVEPPGIFRGRGDHPLAGKIKPRILPEHVTLNVGPDDPVPVCPLPGHAWKEVVQNNEATWLAYYKAGKSSKYVFLAANSKFKGMSDFKKYEKARKLKNQIDHIRQDYERRLEDSSLESRQLGVAAYLIDKLALRVGNEKNEDEADTVGCCSLRVEHIRLDEDNHIILDFLGKDSMRYYNRIKVDEKVYLNLKTFLKGKNQENNLFDLINAGKLNDYLKSLMSGLSAKVFRTYNASVTLQQELDKCFFQEDDGPDAKVGSYNEANKQVAILCNHQKTVSKNFNVQSEALQNNLKDHMNYLLELEDHYMSFRKSKKKEKKEDRKGEVEDTNTTSSKLKKVFPDSEEKTKKNIESLKSKIKKIEEKMKTRVIYLYKII